MGLLPILDVYGDGINKGYTRQIFIKSNINPGINLYTAYG